MIKHIAKAALLSWLAAFSLMITFGILDVWMTMGKMPRETGRIISLVETMVVMATLAGILFTPLTAWASRNRKVTKWFLLLWLFLNCFICVTILVSPSVSFLGSIFLASIGLILIGLLVPKSKNLNCG